MTTPKLKPFPRFETDEAAEAFVAGADLSEYDFSDMKPMHFEFAAKDARINMRLPTDLLAAVKRCAVQERIPYQRFIRRALEGAVGKVG
jgi:predicted DNA binding CopG/RHH family protein